MKDTKTPGKRPTNPHFFHGRQLTTLSLGRYWNQEFEFRYSSW